MALKIFIVHRLSDELLGLATRMLAPTYVRARQSGASHQPVVQSLL